MNDVAHGAVAVEDIAKVRPEILGKKMRTEQPHLLLDGKSGHNRPMRNASFFQIGQHSENDRDPGLVVRPEDGFPVAVDHTLPDDRNHPFCGADRIHVRTEKDGGPVGIAGHAHDQVSRIRTRLGRRAVRHRVETQLVEPRDQVAGHRPLPAGRAVQGGQRDKLIRNMDLHRFSFSRSISMNASIRVSICPSEKLRSSTMSASIISVGIPFCSPTIR